MSDITTSSTYSVGTKSYSNNGFSGMVSGMDTDSMVKKLLSGTQTKIDKQNQTKQVLEWKQDMYRNVISTINEFKGKYLDNAFDSSLKTNLSNADFFNSMVSTVTSGSDCVRVSGASPEASTGDISVAVDHLASASTLSGTAKLSSDTAVSGTLDVSKFTARVVKLKVGSNNISIDLAGVSSKEDLLNRLNDQLIGSATASFTSDNKLAFTTKDSSTAIQVVSGSPNALATLGLSAGVTSSAPSTPSTPPTGQVLTGTAEPNFQSSCTFNVTLNGITKEISVDPKADLDADGKVKLDENGNASINLDSVEKALKQGFSNAFGSYITPNITDPATSATTNTFKLSTSDTSSQFTITGVDAHKIGITPGTSNRLSLDSKLSTILSFDTNPRTTFNINGHDFSFGATDSLQNVLDTVNSSTAGVKMTYSSLSDTFQMAATSSGSGYHINIQSDDGLLHKLFNSTNPPIPTIPTDMQNYSDGSHGYTNITGQDAKATVTMNGITTNVTRSSNNFALNGVNFELIKETAAGTPATISTSRDVDSIVKTVKSFVDDYNKLVTGLRGYTDADRTYKDYPPLTDEQKDQMKDSEITSWTTKAQEGLLNGDDTVLTYLSSMRSALYTKPSNSQYALYDIGIETESFDSDSKATGTLTFDESAFRTAFNADPQSVVNLFTDSQKGVARQLSDICDSAAKVSIVSPGSLVQLAGVSNKSWSSKNNDLYDQIKNINDKISDLKEQYNDERTRYWNKFNAMETALSNFNTQSSWLTSQFSS
jgi:flagellar hook-associated protein 2